MPDVPNGHTVNGRALGSRGFWGIFAAAWLAYLALYVTAAAGAEGMTLGPSLGHALVNTAPPALAGVVVALRRRDLLRPEWSLGRTVLVHIGVGLAFAFVTAVVISTATELVPWDEPMPEGAGKGLAFASRLVSGTFLYIMMAGFLMWTESLRRVHESMSVAAREAMLRAQAEAKALRAQFNPHFVFNTLHSLMLLVRADPAAAERAIEDVATLIRYASALQRQDVDLVPLAKELEVTRRYLALERLRLEDRLKVAWSLEMGPADATVPPFALHTLVENAIKHGLEPRSEGGTVSIRAVAEGASLVLTVSDDGEGADPEAVAGARDHGLQLLGRRLTSLYGDDASLAWRTTPGTGFTATIRLPVRAPAT
jgi:two-component sensor histidine kinase